MKICMCLFRGGIHTWHTHPGNTLKGAKLTHLKWNICLPLEGISSCFIYERIDDSFLPKHQGEQRSRPSFWISLKFPTCECPQYLCSDPELDPSLCTGSQPTGAPRAAWTPSLIAPLQRNRWTQQSPSLDGSNSISTVRRITGIKCILIIKMNGCICFSSWGSIKDYEFSSQIILQQHAHNNCCININCLNRAVFGCTAWCYHFIYPTSPISNV